MRKDDSVRLRHMRDAAREAVGFVGHKRRTDLDDDRMLVFALVKAIEIVGEAANQVSAATRSELPDVPWADIIGMRHRLIHAYSRWSSPSYDLEGIGVDAQSSGVV